MWRSEERRVGTARRTRRPQGPGVDTSVAPLREWGGAGCPIFFSSRRRHTRYPTRDWSSDVCSSDLPFAGRWRRAFRFIPVALAVGALAVYTIRTVLERAGHPAVPLDDAFIHFQYAKRLA